MAAIRTVAKLAVLAGTASAVPMAAASCTTATQTAGFDSLPTGHLDYHKDLQYEGWEVVKLTETPWSSDQSRNVLRMIHDTGIMRAANSHILFNDKTFVFGCASRDAKEAAYCGVHKLYGVPCNYVGCTPPGPSFDFPFDYENNPHSLEAAGGFEPSNTPNITWSIYGTYGNPFPAGEAPQLYIDHYTYEVITCP